MEDKLVKKNLLTNFVWLNFLFIASGLGIILLKKGALPKKLPLFYSRPWGEEQLAPSNYLFLIPLTSFLFLIINYIIGKTLQKKGEEFLALGINAGALLFSFLGVIAVWKIIFLIT